MSTIAEKATQEQVVQGQPSGGSHFGEGVIFLLNNLPFESQDDSPEADPYRVENLAATYHLPLEQILRSKLNATGFIRAIFVNFGPMGYYRLNPTIKPITNPKDFEVQLRELFQVGVIEKYNGMVWQKTDLSSSLSRLPAKSRKLGCLHGADFEEFTDLRDYIKTYSDEQIYVCVVGQIDNQEIQAHIDDYVTVSEYDLIATFVVDTVISIMERKWGI